ncbi:MAG: sulfotransferase, partial [Cyanobacteria bacterium J06600_6]
MISNYVLIIGSIKSGTTSLFNYLAEHPEVAPCKEKEPKFFSNPEIFARGFDFYQSLWSWDSSRHKIALEASPNYTRSTHQDLFNAAEKIAEIQRQETAEFKFIYLMRDPIERIESHYTHLEAWQQEARVQPLSEGLDREIIDVSKYSMQLKEYYQRFPSENILLIDFEDLKQSPEAILKKVAEFLGIDPNYQFQALGKVYNNRSQRKKVVVPGWRKVRQTNLAYYIASRVPKQLKSLFHQVFSKQVKKEVILSESQNQYVASQLQEDVQLLNSQYGFNTERWAN